MTHDVFLSYSHKDKSVADAICSIMEKKGISCWIAPRDINPGVPFAEAIIDGITGAKVFILVYSSNSNHSQQVIKEVDRAVHHGLAIIPFRVEDVPMSKQLEYYISDVHWLDALTPPLERHFDRLYRVVSLLLKMGPEQNGVIEDAFSTGETEKKEPDKVGRFKKVKIVIPAILIAAVLISVSVYIVIRQNRIKWAKNTLLPEIGAQIKGNDVWRNLVKPYRLAEEAEKILGNDSTLEKYISQCSRYIDVSSYPPGAKVYMKEYIHPEDQWTLLGITPMKHIRVPIGIFRWKLGKEGYDTVLAAASTWDIGGEDLISGSSFFRKLDKPDSIPVDMVRVPSTQTEAGVIGDFFIDRYEVTNNEYKKFIDAGGYRTRKYWKYPFIKGGKEISWAEAMNLFVDQSGQSGPSTWIGGTYPEGQERFPVSGVSWYEAAAFADWTGKKLPTYIHWDIARGAYTPMIQYPQLGGFGTLAPFTNFSGKGTVKTGSLPGITSFGAYDMAGNVREWCWNKTSEGRTIRGGSWEDNTYEFGNVRQAPAMDRSPRNGFRLALYIDTTSLPRAAFNSLETPVLRDFRSGAKVPEDIFKIYKEQFSYDPGSLEPVVESRTKNPGGWMHEIISFNAAYGKERILAHLFLPAVGTPSYQTVIYFPGSASVLMPSSKDLENYYEFTMFLSFLITNGRAVMYPVYKGTFERGDPKYIPILNSDKGSETYSYTELIIQEVKDIRRCLDYLLTRPDIDSSKIAFMGMSWGGYMGIIINAVEKRFKANILIAGGLLGYGLPGSEDIDYVSHVTTPTLILNGKYDAIFPPETSSRVLLDLLGTPPKDKKLILYETDHIPPRVEYIKETLSWLDKYLGSIYKE